VTSPDDAMLTTLASVTAAGLAWIAQHTEDTLGAVHEAAPHHEAPTALNRTSVRDDSGALALEMGAPARRELPTWNTRPEHEAAVLPPAGGGAPR